MGEARHDERDAPAFTNKMLIDNCELNHVGKAWVYLVNRNKKADSPAALVGREYPPSSIASCLALGWERETIASNSGDVYAGNVGGLLLFEEMGCPPANPNLNVIEHAGACGGFFCYL